MPHTAAGWISAILCAAVSAYAISVGRGPERIGACACLLGLSDMVVQDRSHWLDPERRLLAVDGGMLLLLLCYLVVQTRRVWAIPAAAAQALCIVIHFVVLRPEHPLHARAYLTAEAGLNYLVLIALAWGAWTVQRNRRINVSHAESR